MTPELLPCPFCGRKVALSVLEDDDDTLISAWVHCICGAETSERPTEEGAVGHWNMRLTSAATPLSPADEIIGLIETRFPDWKSYRDLVDCIDVTLHRLRGGR